MGKLIDSFEFPFWWMYILQVKFSYNLDPFLVYLSVNYVDRFLSKQEILVILIFRVEITFLGISY